MHSLSYAQKWITAADNLERRGIYERIVRYARPSRTDNILDLGCGSCKLIKELCKGSDLSSSMIVGIDHNQELLEEGRRELKKAGYDVNFAFRPWRLGLLLAYEKKSGIGDVSQTISFNRSQTVLKPGINLIGDNYGFSNYPYLYGYGDELDMTFLTFTGGTISRFVRNPRELARIIDGLGTAMGEHSRLIYVDRAWYTSGSLSIPKRLSELSQQFELENTEIVESVENFVFSTHPLTMAFKMSLVEGGKATDNQEFIIDTSKMTFEEVVEKMRKLEEKGYKIGIEFSTFRKK